MPNNGPQITATLSLDTKPYEKQIVQAMGLARKFEREAAALRRKQYSEEKKGSLFGGLSTAAKGVTLGLSAAVTGAGAAFAIGIENAYQYARQMMNLSRATGIATDQIAAYDLAIKDSQINTSEIIMSTKMMNQELLQAARGENNSRRRFEQLGLSYKELIHMPIAEAFDKAGEALAGVENPALRAAGAVALFGRTGARMLKLFERGGALQMAREALGAQGGIIARSGAAFEQIAIRLSHIGVKIRGFFMGVAEVILPMMEKFTAIFHKMDFTAWGKQFANTLKGAMIWIVAFFKDPKKTGEYFWEYAKLKAMELGNILIDVGYKFGAALADAVINALPEKLKLLLGLSGWKAPAAPIGGKDHLGAAEQAKKAAALRPNAALAAAATSLGVGQPTVYKVTPTRFPLWRLGGMGGFGGAFGGLNQATGHSSLQGESMTYPNRLKQFKDFNALNARDLGRMNVSLSSMRKDAYGQSPLLRSGELSRFRSSAIAARSGRRLAAGNYGPDPFMGDDSVQRRPGETHSGDRQRAKAFAKELQRKELHQGSEVQLLGDIAENTDETKKIMQAAFK